MDQYKFLILGSLFLIILIKYNFIYIHVFKTVLQLIHYQLKILLMEQCILFFLI